MKDSARYVKVVGWSEEDGCYRSSMQVSHDVQDLQNVHTSDLFRTASGLRSCDSSNRTAGSGHTVHVAPVSHVEDRDATPCVIDLIEDSVATYPNAPTFSANQLDTSGGPRNVAQPTECLTDAVKGVRWQISHFLLGAPQDDDGVGHYRCFSISERACWSGMASSWAALAAS